MGLYIICCTFFSIIMLYSYTFTKAGHVVTANYRIYVHCFAIDIDVCIFIISLLYTIFKFIRMHVLQHCI